MFVYLLDIRFSSVKWMYIHISNIHPSSCHRSIILIVRSVHEAPALMKLNSLEAACGQHFLEFPFSLLFSIVENFRMKNNFNKIYPFFILKQTNRRNETKQNKKIKQHTHQPQQQQQQKRFSEVVFDEEIPCSATQNRRIRQFTRLHLFVCVCVRGYIHCGKCH